MSGIPERRPSFCPEGAWRYILSVAVGRHRGIDLLAKLLTDEPDAKALWTSLRKRGVKDDDWESWRALLSFFMYCEPGAGFDPDLKNALSDLERDLREIGDRALELSALLQKASQQAQNHGIKLPRGVCELRELMRPRWNPPEPVWIEYGFGDLGLSDLLLYLAESAGTGSLGVMAETQCFATVGYDKLLRQWVWHFDAGFLRHVIPYVHPNDLRLGHADLARLARLTLSASLGPDDDITEGAVRKAREAAPTHI